MTKYYLTLADGRKVRAEWDMNAMYDFTILTGKDLSDLAMAKSDLGLLRTIAYCAIKEGEAIDGREFDITEIELGRLIGVKELVAFLEILSEMTDVEQKKSEPPKRLLKMFTRGR